MVGKELVVMIVLATADAAFQLCENPADLKSTKVFNWKCSIAQNICSHAGIGFSWENGECAVEKSYPGHDAKAACVAKGGTATDRMTCASLATVYMPHVTSAMDVAKCNAMHPTAQQPHHVLFAMAGGLFGCCGDTNHPKDVCSKLVPSTQICASSADWKPGHVYEIVCHGIAYGKCGQTDSVGQTGFVWDDNQCKVRFDKLTDAEQNANKDIVKICTDAGGTVDGASFCGQTLSSMNSVFPMTYTKAWCDNDHTFRGSTSMPGTLWLNNVANVNGCCGGSMHTRKDVCTTLSPMSFRVCKDHSKWLHQRVFKVKCYGLTAASCTGSGFEHADKECHIQATSPSVDPAAVCTAKGGKPVTDGTCGSFNMMTFRHQKAVKATCALTSPIMATSTYGAMSGMFTSVFGCCGVGGTDCCGDTACDGTIPLPPQTTSLCAPPLVSVLVFVIGFCSASVM